MGDKKKPIQNGTCDEDSSTSEEINSERKPQFELGDV